MTSYDCDLAVIGAGLSGTALLATLHLQGWKGSALLVEAGRGAGGRAATRLRRDDPDWRLDHGAPVLHLSSCNDGPLADLLIRLQGMGALISCSGDAVCLGLEGVQPAGDGGDGFAAQGPRWRGFPSMASVSEAMLALAGDHVRQHFGQRVQGLERFAGGWELLGQQGEVIGRAPVLVLSGNLLAHGRSLAMLGVQNRPLRDAVPEGVDGVLDRALDHLDALTMEPRWNRMFELKPLGADATAWPRLIGFTSEARASWGLDRLVLQPQSNGRVGMVAHGFNPEVSVDPAWLAPWPSLAAALASATDLGVMRWGAARPLDHPLPAAWQWCPQVRLGFCGDWIEGPGFATAFGALRSAVDLAAQLLHSEQGLHPGAEA